MEFDLDEDERALQEGVRAWCTGRAGSERIRATADTGGVDRDLFRELAEQGVLGLCAPEADAGLDLGATHAAVVFEELGRALVPGPIVATHLAAGRVDGAADGTTIVTEHVAGDRLLRHPQADAVMRVDVDGLALYRDAAPTALEQPFDPLTGVAPVDDAGWGNGEPVGGPDAVVDWRRRRTLLVSAQLLGAAVGATDLAVGYAGEREQFGRVIGSFQSVKHLCADALTRAEVARAAVYAAACHLDGRADDTDGADAALAAAALLAADAAVANAKTCIQVHGGMGFTWEVDAHLFLKRATVWAAQVGPSHDHAERAAAVL